MSRKTLSIFFFILCVVLTASGGAAGAQILHFPRADPVYRPDVEDSGIDAGDRAGTSAALQAGGRTVRFVATADLHYPDVDPQFLPDLIAMRQTEEIRGIVIAGDLSWEWESWNDYAAAIESDKYYIYDGWGNHDAARDDFESQVVSAIGERDRDGLVNTDGVHYSWDWEGVHFVQLNLKPDDDRKSRNSLAFLRDDLASHVGTSGRPVVLVYHVPCRSNGVNGWTEGDLQSVIQNYTVVAVISGHLHYVNSNWERSCAELNLRHFIAGPAVTPQSNPSEVVGGYFLEVTMRENGANNCPEMEITKKQHKTISDIGRTSFPFASPDNAPPTTSHRLDGKLGEYGWYTSTVKVTLSAEDARIPWGCEGVWKTEYRIDGGNWQTYTVPFASEDGQHTLSYQSVDKAGNMEGVNSFSIKKDTTPPTCGFNLNRGTSPTHAALVRVRPLATDATSGVYQMRLRDPGGAWSAWYYLQPDRYWRLSDDEDPRTGQTYTVEAQFKDWAGNDSEVCSDTITLDLYPARPASDNYRLTASTWGVTDIVGSSADFRLHGTLGQPSMIGHITSTDHSLWSGYWVMRTVRATDDAYSVDEDHTLEVGAAQGVLANDRGWGNLAAGLEGEVGHGTLNLEADGSFTYTPHLNYNGGDSFTYRASDGLFSSSIAKVTVTVNPVNDPPAAKDDAADTLEDTPRTVAVLGNDSDVDRDPLTVVAVGTSANGDAITDGNTVTYTPTLNFSGSDVFTYTISDPNGLTDSAGVTITVGDVNERPTAADDAAATDEDTPTTIPVSDNDDDPDGDTLVVAQVGRPANGDASSDGWTVTFTPTPNFFGSDVFTYTVSDGELTDAAAVTVTVYPVNDPPTAVDDAVATDEDTPTTIPVLGNDDDPDGTPLSVEKVGAAANGDTATDGNTVTYTPTLNFAGNDVFTYTVGDGDGGHAAATVNITVASVNDVPMFSHVPDQRVAMYGSVGPLNFRVWDVETPADELVVACASSDTTLVPEGGMRLAGSGTRRTLIITPTTDMTGTATITLTASDGIDIGSGAFALTVYEEKNFYLPLLIK